METKELFTYFETHYGVTKRDCFRGKVVEAFYGLKPGCLVDIGCDGLLGYLPIPMKKGTEVFVSVISVYKSRFGEDRVRLSLDSTTAA